MKEEEPSEATGTEEQPGVEEEEEGGAMEVSVGEGTREGGREEEEAVKSLPSQVQEAEGGTEPALAEEDKEREEVTMEENPVVEERQGDGAAADPVTTPPDHTSSEMAQVEPQTGQREPPRTTPPESHDTPTNTESVPQVTESPTEPPPAPNDNSEKPSSPSLVPPPEGLGKPRDPEPQPSSHESEPQNMEETGRAQDSGLEELYSGSSPDRPSGVDPVPVPSTLPPPATSSDYFSDSREDEPPVACTTAPVVTPVPPAAMMPPASRPPPLFPRTQNHPSSFAPPSLDSIPLPSQAPPLQTLPRPQPSKPPGTGAELKASGEVEVSINWNMHKHVCLSSIWRSDSHVFNSVAPQLFLSFGFKFVAT